MPGRAIGRATVLLASGLVPDRPVLGDPVRDELVQATLRELEAAVAAAAPHLPPGERREIERFVRALAGPPAMQRQAHDAP